jgi:hypothetical protein
MLRNYVFAIVAISAFAQTPQQIQQRQQAQERALQREAEARDQQQHQAQEEQMRAIDRQQAEDQREQNARAAQAQAIAAQEKLYMLQQQAEQQKLAERQKQDLDQNSVTQSLSVAPGSHVDQSPPQQQTQPAVVPHWSFRNMSNRDKAGLAGLGVVLVALAFAAGIIPPKFIPKWLGGPPAPPVRH